MTTKKTAKEPIYEKYEPGEPADKEAQAKIAAEKARKKEEFYDVDEVVDDVPEPVYVFWPGGVRVLTNG